MFSRGIITLIIMHIALFHHICGQDCTTGRDCCNCQNVTECATYTGKCTSGCKQTLPPGYGWGGDWCNIGNLALNRPATQGYNTLKTHMHFGANLAVDGHTGPHFASGHCMHTLSPPSGNYSWWMVDLEHPARVISVTLFNRVTSEHRLNHFYIRVGNSSTIESHSVCGYHNGFVPSKGNVTIKCSPRLVGQFVSVQLSEYTRTSPGNSEPGDLILHFCEAVVTGYFYKECPPGKKPSLTCKEDCNDGTYGSWCIGTCVGFCLNDKPCDKVTGICSGGCKLWYIGHDCSIHLQNPTAPLRLEAVNSNTSHVLLLWTRPANIPEEGKQHLQYVLQYKQADTPSGKSVVVKDNGQAELQSKYIRQLNYNTVYEFQVFGQYVGWGDFRNGSLAMPLQVKTACIAPQIGGVTSDVKVADNNMMSVTIKWQYVIRGCSSLIQFVVKFGSDKLYLAHHEANADLHYWKTEGIDSSLTYYFRLTTTNNKHLVFSTPVIEAGKSPGTGKAALRMDQGEVQILPIILWVCLGVCICIIVALAVVIVFKRKHPGNQNKKSGHDGPAAVSSQGVTMSDLDRQNPSLDDDLYTELK